MITQYPMTLNHFSNQISAWVLGTLASQGNVLTPIPEGLDNWFGLRRESHLPH